MSKRRDTPRAAGLEREGEQEVKPGRGRAVSVEGWRTKMGNGAMKVSVSVTLFHMVDALFKRPITL